MARILAALLLALPAPRPHALVRGESVEGALVWRGGRQFIVDRGAGDGVAVGDHAQVLQDGRYRSRAACLKVQGGHSLWAIYNVYEPLVLTKGVLLKSSTPVPLDGVRGMDLRVPDGEEFRARVRPRRRARAGAPREDADLALARRIRASEGGGPGSAGAGGDGGLVLRAGLAPLRVSNMGGGHEMAYRVSLSRGLPDGPDVEGALSYERSSFVRSDTGAAASESRYDGRLVYEYAAWGGRLRPFGMAVFERRREGPFHPVVAAVDAGPLGVARGLGGGGAGFLESASLAYIPMVSYRSREVPGIDSATGRPGFVGVSEVGLRHAALLRARASFLGGALSVAGAALAGPLQDLDGLGLDFGDLGLKVETEASYRFHRRFSGSYVVQVLGGRRPASPSLPTTEVAHLFTVNYEARL